MSQSVMLKSWLFLTFRVKANSDSDLPLHTHHFFIFTFCVFTAHDLLLVRKKCFHSNYTFHLIIISYESSLHNSTPQQTGGGTAGRAELCSEFLRRRPLTILAGWPRDGRSVCQVEYQGTEAR